jgi:pimeloyl-ACP methyl ester carboxylesterase
VDILVQSRRDQHAAERVLRRVLDAQDGVEPRVLITDKLASYVPAIKRVLTKTEHRRHKRLNNRAENSHRPVRKRKRAMQRFKSPEQAQQFLEAIDPAPFRGVLPVPVSALKAGFPVLQNPANRGRAVPLTFAQFRYSFANAVSEEEAHRLFDKFAVPASGAPIWQAVAANFNPWSETRVDTRNPLRGPLLLISSENDHTVPWSIVDASYELHKHNPGVTEVVQIPNPRARPDN